MILVKNYLKNKVKKRRGELVKPLDLEDGQTLRNAWNEAERLLLMNAQKVSCQDEYERLSKKKPIRKTSSLVQLDPFMDDGIIRVGGRLKRMELPYDKKHQVLVPKNAKITPMLIRHFHRMVAHLGKNSILALLRKNYWIPGASRMIKSLVAKCVLCRKQRGKLKTQKMANLPIERLKPDVPPFTDTGMDFFGPLEVKRGRASVKRYGVIFTCAASRAVHLEVAYGLDTSSCINAIRRFIARRGTVKSIRSDNGTNLVGSKREMQEAINKWNKSEFSSYLHNYGVSWSWNPPSGSHFGAFWERLIRSIRRILYSLIKDQGSSLDDEALLTLMCEAESIMNNRPITLVSDDPNDLRALSPNDLLLLEPGTSFPPGLFDADDNYARRRWRQIQYLANVFWSRWIKEYIPLLQKRQKWHFRERNISEGDIVLIADNTPRGSWALGKVVKAYPDYEGLVRICDVKTKSNVLRRPIHKLCPVLEVDVDED